MTFEDFSYEIGIENSYLSKIAYNHKRLYNRVIIPKKRGKKRILDIPNPELKAIQRWILNNYLNEEPISKYSHGFIKKRGIKSNASVHLGNRYILNMDIKSFFPSIMHDDVTKYFAKIGFEEKDAKKMANLCTIDNHLPQGAPTSPQLSNIIFLPIDNEIAKICNNDLLLYSRYADDLSFSSNSLYKLKPLKEKITQLLKENSFTVQKRKTRFCVPGSRLHVTGLRLNDNKLSIGRNKKRYLRALIHNYIMKSNKKTNKNEILGLLSFLKDIEPERYNDFLEYINKLIERKKHYSSE